MCAFTPNWGISHDIRPLLHAGLNVYAHLSYDVRPLLHAGLYVYAHLIGGYHIIRDPFYTHAGLCVYAHRLGEYHIM